MSNARGRPEACPNDWPEASTMFNRLLGWEIWFEPHRVNNHIPFPVETQINWTSFASAHWELQASWEHPNTACFHWKEWAWRPPVFQHALLASPHLDHQLLMKWVQPTCSVLSSVLVDDGVVIPPFICHLSLELASPKRRQQTASVCFGSMTTFLSARTAPIQITSRFIFLFSSSTCHQTSMGLKFVLLGGAGWVQFTQFKILHRLDVLVYISWYWSHMIPRLHHFMFC